METERKLVDDMLAEARLKYYNEILQSSEKLNNEELLHLIKKKFSEEKMSKLARYLAVKYILRKYKIITDFRTDAIKAYDNEKKYFRDIGEEIIKSFLTEKIDMYNTKTTSQEIIHLLKTMTYIDDEEIKKAHSDDEIPLKNGILNIKDMEFLPHDSKYLFDYQIPILYDPDKKCLGIQKFISELVKEDEIDIIYDIFGLALYPKNFIEKFFVFTGTGSNGKSKLINLLEYFIGNENCSSISLKQLTEDKFSVARTYKKLLNVGADIGGQTIRDTSMLKSASASDKISGQFKFGQIFDFTPSALQIFSANDPPIFADSSEGMYRRCETILFPNKFGNEKDIEEDSTCKRADPKVIEKLSNSDEISGMLNIALKHLKNIINTGQLSKVKSTTQLKKDYTMYADNVKSFIEETCEEAEYIPPDYEKDGKEKIQAIGFLPVSGLYDKYCEFCDKNKLVKKSKDGFSKRIKHIDSWNLEFGQQDICNEKKVRSIRGIRFKIYDINGEKTANTPKTPDLSNLNNYLSNSVKEYIDINNNDSSLQKHGNTAKSANTPKTSFLSLIKARERVENNKREKGVLGDLGDLAVFGTKTRMEFDEKFIIYQKCSVDICNNVECNLDSANMPYCIEHWEVMGQK